MAPSDVEPSGAEAASDASSIPTPPPPPNPSADPKLLYLPSPESDITSPRLVAQVDDIFKVSPLAALKLLSAGIESLVDVTGDIPPTPPPRSPTIPHMRGMEAEKKSIVRSNSEKNLARLLQQATSRSPRPGSSQSSDPRPPTDTSQKQSIDGVHLRTPNPTPPPGGESDPQPPLEPYVIVGENSQPLNLQHSAITRKFYSRLPPPISITEYLLRIHRFCPMSTAVYLATSLYIHRLAVLERAIAVTRRNAHRLLLAGLRVAMKALEDLSYAHSKFAKVGGVSESELARLEISFCFLTGFELVVSEESLQQQWEMLRRGRESWELSDQPPQDVTILSVPHPPRRAVATASAGG
ncbi:cyclin-domain-containing protein [Cercophora newfieldiana]|uniref:Cyclin-domain-containing protein n=1 Tax=Cercophora newfieldiana TaxID=92897 RepID=A0AA39XVC5_9PEZI|nr:cyclin-domain-containing protein [Cercophora newfieldiana]